MWFVKVTPQSQPICGFVSQTSDQTATTTTTICASEQIQTASQIGRAKGMKRERERESESDSGMKKSCRLDTETRIKSG